MVRFSSLLYLVFSTPSGNHHHLYPVKNKVDPGAVVCGDQRLACMYTLFWADLVSHNRDAESLPCFSCQIGWLALLMVAPAAFCVQSAVPLYLDNANFARTNYLTDTQ